MQVRRNAVFIDTGAFVALFLKKDLNHEKSAKIFQKLKKSRAVIYTSDYIIDETVTLLSVKANHSKSVDFLDSIRQSKIITIIPVFDGYFQKACDLFRKYDDKGFSFTDVSSFAIMRELDIPIAFAFDKHFVQAGFEVLR